MLLIIKRPYNLYWLHFKVIWPNPVCLSLAPCLLIVFPNFLVTGVPPWLVSPSLSLSLCLSLSFFLSVIEYVVSVSIRDGDVPHPRTRSPNYWNSHSSFCPLLHRSFPCRLIYCPPSFSHLFSLFSSLHVYAEIFWKVFVWVCACVCVCVCVCVHVCVCVCVCVCDHSTAAEERLGSLFDGHRRTNTVASYS